MRVLVSCLVLALLAGCHRGGPASDDQTAADLRQKVEQMFKDIDAGNFAGLKMWADDQAILFDFDENNAPVTARGQAELDKYLAAYDGVVRKGLKIHTEIGKDDCFGDSDIGYCAVEYDQTIGAEGAPPAPFKFRGTLIARKTKDGWRWVHWHSSFREFPKPAAPAAPAATETPPADQAPANPSPQ
ncbi:MAG TPA: nuclear transport factor 2 family protein [Nevskiaceae bacterium]|nr:nuclear transport factor 2 family protein [Nevskiaceae bacterium]